VTDRDKSSNNNAKVTISKRTLILSLVIVVSLSTILLSSGLISSTLLSNTTIRVAAQSSHSSSSPSSTTLNRAPSSTSPTSSSSTTRAPSTTTTLSPTSPSGTSPKSSSSPSSPSSSTTSLPPTFSPSPSSNTGIAPGNTGHNNPTGTSPTQTSNNPGQSGNKPVQCSSIPTLFDVQKVKYPITANTLQNAGFQFKFADPASGEPEAAQTSSGLPQLTGAQYDDKGRLTCATSVTIPITIEYPDWTNVGSLCAAIQQEWSQYLNRVLAAEQEHVNIIEQGYAGFGDKIVGKTIDQAGKENDKIAKQIQKQSDALEPGHLGIKLDLSIDNTPECQCTANPGKSFCNGQCVDPSAFQSDPSNCGSCGHACASGDTCSNGVCQSQCTDPRAPDSCGNGVCCNAACGRPCDTASGGCGFSSEQTCQTFTCNGQTTNVCCPLWAVPTQNPNCSTFCASKPGC
jgi:predicted secreted Zn-dependent protease